MGIGRFRIAKSFSRSAAIPFLEIENPKKIASDTESLHLDGFRISPYFKRREKTISNRECSSSTELPQTATSSRRPAVNGHNGSRTSSMKH